MENDWEQIQAPHTSEGGSGIPLWRQRIPKEGWLVVSGTGNICFIPDTGEKSFDGISSWEPEIIENAANS